MSIIVTILSQIVWNSVINHPLASYHFKNLLSFFPKTIEKCQIGEICFCDFQKLINLISYVCSLFVWFYFLNLFLSYPLPPTKLRVVYWNHFVRPPLCPSVCAKFVSVPYLIEDIGSSQFTQRLLITRGCNYLDPSSFG